MSSLIFSAPLLSLLLAATPVPTAVPTGLTVTYLANEGFLLSGGGQNILVDALFGEGVAGYPVLDASTRQALEEARPPYDDVALILATHEHADHFDARAVAAHLAHNPRALFVSTPRAVRLLRETAPAALHGRMRALNPGDGASIRLEHAGISLEALGLHHGRNRRPPVENLGFLLTLGGVRLLHVGDAETTSEDLAPFQLAASGLDVAFLPTWLLYDEPWKDTVPAVLTAHELVVMHVPTDAAPASWFGESRTVAGMARAITAAFPGTRVMTSPSTTFRLTAREGTEGPP